MQTYRQLQERNLNKWTSFGTYKTKLVVIDPVHPNMPWCTLYTIVKNIKFMWYWCETPLDSVSPSCVWGRAGTRGTWRRRWEGWYSCWRTPVPRWSDRTNIIRRPSLYEEPEAKVFMKNQNKNLLWRTWNKGFYKHSEKKKNFMRNLKRKWNDFLTNLCTLFVASWQRIYWWSFTSWRARWSDRTILRSQ